MRYGPGVRGIDAFTGGPAATYVLPRIVLSSPAASILVIQVILNALGTVDVLPLTGVTFPFLSNGGTSMIGAWGLLAFVKAADTRQNASFAVRLNNQGGEEA